MPLTYRTPISTAAVGAMTPAEHRRMADQARELRKLMAERGQSAVSGLVPGTRRAVVISVIGGKGGVGKSHVALNLAVSLSELGARVCLIDAHPGFGNLDLLSGLNGYWNLSHVVDGTRRLADVLLDGPGGVTLLPGGSALATIDRLPTLERQHVERQMLDFEAGFDFWLIDTGTGLTEVARRFALASDRAVVVTTTEATAVADAYATIKSLRDRARMPLQLLINQAADQQQGMRVAERLLETAKGFLRLHLESLGVIPEDTCVTEAVASRRPFVLSHPTAPASVAIREVAERIKSAARTTRAGNFIDRFWMGKERAAA